MNRARDGSEQQQRPVTDLAAMPAIPWAGVAFLLDVPVSTLDKMRGEGRGPRCFRIGRRLYVRQADMRDWLDRLASEGEGDDQ